MSRRLWSRFAWVALTTLIFCGASPAAADVVVSYDFTGLSGVSANAPATSTAAGITASPITRGLGLAGASASGGLSSSGWTSSASPDLVNDFYEFTLTPSPLATMTLTRLSFGELGSATRPANFTIRTSLDGFASSTVLSTTPTVLPIATSSSATNQTFTLTSAYAALTAPLSVRIYAYGGSTSGTWRLVNYNDGGGGFADGGLIVEGSVVVAVPEAGGWRLVALASAVAAASCYASSRRRWRLQPAVA